MHAYFPAPYLYCSIPNRENDNAYIPTCGNHFGFLALLKFPEPRFKRLWRTRNPELRSYLNGPAIRSMLWNVGRADCSGRQPSSEAVRQVMSFVRSIIDQARHM